MGIIENFINQWIAKIVVLAIEKDMVYINFKVDGSVKTFSPDRYSLDRNSNGEQVDMYLDITLKSQ